MNFRKNHTLWMGILLPLLLALPARGQSFYAFGKNKVQYSTFDWQRMETPHFDIYFYTEEEEIAEVGAAMAEESYTFLERKFSHTVLRRIPLIFYSLPAHFQETNTISGLIPENVAGFTEFIKGRVVLPHNGSFADFRRVIRHELVHVFMFDKIRSVLKEHRISSFRSPPLWFSEGLAEYWSDAWDARAEMILRDATLSGTLVPISRMPSIYGTFKMYKEGESIVAFFAERYGEDKLALLLDNVWRDERFEDIFHATIGDPLSKLDADWQYAVKKRHFPAMDDGDMPSRAARRLTRHGVNVNPAVVPSSVDSTSFVFLSNRTGYAEIYRRGIRAQDRPEKIVRGGRSAEFVSFHASQSKLSVSKEGVLAFVSQSRGRDVLYLWDLASGEVIRAFSFESLVSLSSPSWSPDGHRIVFSGVEYGGRPDLYLLSLPEGTLRNLTDDVYSDRDPDWSPDGGRIAFSSDRTKHGAEGFHNLFIYDLGAAGIEQLTCGEHNDSSPSWSPDGGRIAFSSDRSGVFDLYALSVHADTLSSEPESSMRDGASRIDPSPLYTQVTRITHVLTGALDPVWLPDGREILFSAYENDVFQIYRAEVPSDGTSEEQIVPAWTGPSWRPDRIRREFVRTRARYRPKVSLDLAQSYVMQDPEFGTSGGVQIALTDVLGDHHYYLFLSNTAESTEDLWSSFNFALSRFDLRRRVNLAWGIFRLDEHYPEGYYYSRYRERRTGGFLSVQYPLSIFERIEGNLVVRSSVRDWFSGESQRLFLLSGFVSYTKDNSLWGPTGPLDGERYNLGVGQTVDLGALKIHHITGFTDYRRYIRLSKRSAFAVRLLGRSSWGREPQHFWMGGSWTFRGFRHRSIGGRHLVLLNNELRFPLIDNLLIGLPIGRIGFRAFRGALFFDVGNAWNQDFGRVLGSFGAGIRLRVARFLIFRLDAARRTDFKIFEHDTHWEFFFGWDF